MAIGDIFTLVLFTPIVGRQLLRCCFIVKTYNRRMGVATKIEGAWCLVTGLNSKMYLLSTEFVDIF